MKSAVFERQQGNNEQALATVDTALAKFPKFAKLHMIKGQILTDKGDLSAARAAYAVALKACPKIPTLWILASRLEEKDGRAIKSRAMLEKARLVNPKEDTLWAEAVGVEERSSGAQQAKTVLARGMHARARSFAVNLPTHVHSFTRGARSARLSRLRPPLVHVNLV